MQYLNIYKARIDQFIERVYEMRYTNFAPLEASFIYDSDTPIPLAEIESRTFQKIAVGEQWGELWGSAWFRFEGKLGDEHAGHKVVALIDVGGEGCVFEDGEPVRGLTYKEMGDEVHVKRRVPITSAGTPGQEVSLLVEAAANSLFGERKLGNKYPLRQAEIASFHRDIWQLALDLKVLWKIALSLPEDSSRMHKITHGLNRVANLWNDGKGIRDCKQITESLLQSPANASDMTVYSIGHAHIDLGWLWPVRETRRKGGRTFSTALRSMEEYPEYVFGASQPQLYQWVKEDYPRLYGEIKKRVAEGRWELQGAMWVEPDMNVTGGESLVRQCLYGKQFYRDEFGQDVKNLWLPDVFGYSAALPQILKKSGVDIFMTQKISWNETNVFPHHTFFWEGIDGTRILTHFLPTNTYNLANEPKELIESQKRFAQLDVQNEFLNLYGTGDGGGGPSKGHIERALRLRDCEGVPKVKLAFAEAFFDAIRKSKTEDLPQWVGELYLELHRGTLTTQGKMKWYNRRLERELRFNEFLATICTKQGHSYPKERFDAVWKDTLLNQFHDILPGSSITQVYRDAHTVSEENLGLLDQISTESMQSLFGAHRSGTESPAGKAWVVVNSSSFRRTEVVLLQGASESDSSAGCIAVDGAGQSHACYQTNAGMLVEVSVPSMGYTTLTLAASASASESASEAPENQTNVTENLLENAILKVTFGEDGTIDSIYDKSLQREFLDGSANRLLLWEDLPYSWDAWDVSHYYRETKPVMPEVEKRSIHTKTAVKCTIYQKLRFPNSVVEQWISLAVNSRRVDIENRVDWNEKSKLLKAHAETSIHASLGSYEIQYGTIERTTHENTSWDHAQFEVAGHRFADISQPDRGFALLNDCKYGYSTYGNSIELSLLRSPNAPDPEADRGIHEFTYAYVPHPGVLADSCVLDNAHALNEPLLIVPVKETPDSLEKSWFWLEDSGLPERVGDTRSALPGGVRIESVKVAESGSGFVVRAYETRGADASVTLFSSIDWSEAFETDLMENKAAPKLAKLDANSIELDFSPFEIKTILFE